VKPLASTPSDQIALNRWRCGRNRGISQLRVRDRYLSDNCVPNSPYHSPPRTRGPAVPHGKCLILAVAAIPRHPSIVPGFQVTRTHSLFYSLFSYHYLYSSSHQLVLWLLPCFWYSTLSLCVLSITQSRLIEPEVEVQLSRYHRWRGCSFSVVDFAKNFPDRRALYTRRYQESGS